MGNGLVNPGGQQWDAQMAQVIPIHEAAQLKIVGRNFPRGVVGADTPLDFHYEILGKIADDAGAWLNAVGEFGVHGLKIPVEGPRLIQCERFLAGDGSAGEPFPNFYPVAEQPGVAPLNIASAIVLACARRPENKGVWLAQPDVVFEADLGGCVEEDKQKVIHSVRAVENAITTAVLDTHHAYVK